MTTSSGPLRRTEGWPRAEIRSGAKGEAELVFRHFPCVHAAATTPAQRLNVSLRSFHPDVSVFPDRVVGSTCALSFSRIARRSLPLRTLFEIRQTLFWRRRALRRTSRPGDRRTAHSATAGTAPVPSHIACFRRGRRPGAERRSLIARYAWPGLIRRRPNPRDYRYVKTKNATGNCNFELTPKGYGAIRAFQHRPLAGRSSSKRRIIVSSQPLYQASFRAGAPLTPITTAIRRCSCCSPRRWPSWPMCRRCLRGWRRLVHFLSRTASGDAGPRRAAARAGRAVFINAVSLGGSDVAYWHFSDLGRLS